MRSSKVPLDCGERKRRYFGVVEDRNLEMYKLVPEKKSGAFDPISRTGRKKTSSSKDLGGGA